MDSSTMHSRGSPTRHLTMRKLFLHPSSPRKHAGDRAAATAGGATNRFFQEAIMESSITSVEQIIRRWDPEGSDYSRITSLFHESRDEAARFIRAVNELHRDMLSFARSNPQSSVLVRAQGLMTTAMNRLWKEFYQILAANLDRLDSDMVVSSTRSSASTSTSAEKPDEIYDASSTFVFTDDDEEDDDDDDDIRVQPMSDSAVYPSQRFPLTIMASLRSIAQCMVSNGYSRECIEAYKLARTSVVQKGLARNGFHLSSTGARAASGSNNGGTILLDHRIDRWVDAAPTTIRTLFAGERILSDFVFGNEGNSDDLSPSSAVPINESCFTVVARDAAVRFLAFPAQVAAETLKGMTGGAGSKRTGRAPPQRIFGLLDMYNTLAVLWPEVDSVFSYYSTSSVQKQLISSIISLGEAVRAMLTDFELVIQRDSSKTTLPGGGLHPLTQYVMDYVVKLADEHHTALAEIYADYLFQSKTPTGDVLSTYVNNTTSLSVPSSPCRRKGEENRGSPDASPSFVAFSHYSSASNNVSPRLAWLLIVLLCKLDGKAELYKDAALSYLFLANNLRYMNARVRGSKRLREFLGREWTTTHENKAGAFFRSFERLAWNNVLEAIPADAGTFILEKEGVAGVRARMEQFNRAFQEAYKKQASCVVLDREAREDVRADLAARIAEPYRLFYDHCRPVLRRDRESIGVVRFTPDDVTHYLKELYEPEVLDEWASTSVVGSVTALPRSPDQCRSSGTSRHICRTAVRKICSRLRTAG